MTKQQHIAELSLLGLPHIWASGSPTADSFVILSRRAFAFPHDRRQSRAPDCTASDRQQPMTRHVLLSTRNRYTQSLELPARKERVYGLQYTASDDLRPTTQPKDFRSEAASIDFYDLRTGLDGNPAARQSTQATRDRSE